MPVLSTGEVPDLIPEGEILEAAVADVEERSFEWNQETVHKLRWQFVVTEPGPFNGKSVYGETSKSFTAHPNCKAYSWACAIAGRSFSDGEQLDTDDLISLGCKVVIRHKPDKQGRVWANVDDVFPKRVVAQRPAASIEEAPF